MATRITQLLLSKGIKPVESPTVGITERGDVRFHEEGVAKLDANAFNVLISKDLPAKSYVDWMRAHKDRWIFHATTTGWGGSILEPGVKPFRERLARLRAFIRANGFNQDQVVIRVDPIIPTREGFMLAEAVIAHAWQQGFRRFRYSFLDYYKHAEERFAARGLELPEAVKADPYRTGKKSDGMMVFFMRLFCFALDAKVVFESCAEQLPDRVGCVSKRDFNILGLDSSCVEGKSNQRGGCQCCGNKRELLTHRGPCGHGCAYCFWRGNEDWAGEKSHETLAKIARGILKLDEIRIFTSYLAMSKHFNRYWRANAVEISLKPRNYFVSKPDPRLAPTPDILWEYKANPGPEAERRYTKRFLKEVLGKLDAHEIAKEYNMKVMCCFETPEKFCHRHIIASWLRAHGYWVAEWEPSGLSALEE